MSNGNGMVMAMSKEPVSCHLLCQRYFYGLSLSAQSELNFVLTPAVGTSGCCSAHCMKVLGRNGFPRHLGYPGLV